MEGPLCNSVTEREAVAVVTGIKHFQPYLYGNQFTFHTDHKMKELHDLHANLPPFSPGDEVWV